MKITSSAGASLRSAEQAARNHARQNTPIIRPGTVILGNAGAEALRIGGWTFGQDADGNLIAIDEHGRTVIVAHATDTHRPPDTLLGTTNPGDPADPDGW